VIGAKAEQWKIPARWFSEAPESASAGGDAPPAITPEQEKRLQAVKEIKQKTYAPSKGLQMLRMAATPRNLDETFEVAVKLNLDVRKGDQIIRSNLTLPHPHGKKRVRVIVFAEDSAIDVAKQAGADVAGLDNVIAWIKSRKLRLSRADKVLAVPSVFKKVQKEVSKILGPKGLMPNPKLGTVVEESELATAVDLFKNRTISLKTTKFPLVFAGIGKMSMSDEVLLENLREYLVGVTDRKPKGAKGKYLKSVHLSSTMTPSVELDISYCDPTSRFFMRDE